MKAVISVELDGARFAVDEGAFVALRSYLERAGARLGAHPDRDEVIAGLERSIAVKLAARAGASGAAIEEAEMIAALKEVGRVDGPSLHDDGLAGPSGASVGPRQLYRVREGQQIAGVCKGLAVFTGIDVGLVRLVFLLGAVFSGGVVAVAYVVLMLIMPTAR